MTNANAPRRAAIYARVSTFDQEPENQLAELRQYVTARGWSAHEYVDQIALLLDNPNELVRIFSIRALVDLGSRDHIGKISELLADHDENVRHAAQLGLAKLGATEHQKPSKD